MSIEVNFPTVIKIGYILYITLLLMCAELFTAVAMIPMVVLSAHAVWAKPKAICVIGDNEALCLAVIEGASQHLEIPEIHIYSIDHNELNKLGIYDGDTQTLYEFEDEDEQE
jgi:hypothetical protein